MVNCIILGRAEMFASKNGILDSALDGIGMGIGFTITLTIMGTIPRDPGLRHLDGRPGRPAALPA